MKIHFYFLMTSLLFMLSGCGNEPAGLTEADSGNRIAASGDAVAVRRQEKVLVSKLAGGWYPADAGELQSVIESLDQSAGLSQLEDVIGLILPHAGYRYSGVTAFSGLKTLDREFKRIVVIGPSHRAPIQNVFSVPDASHYQTPLGKIPLDTDFIDKLLAHDMFISLPQVHSDEHSVQIQAPLLQYTQKDFKLVPVVAGHCSLSIIRRTAELIKNLCDDDTLVIASSDFTHYGQAYGYTPFTDNIPGKIKELDMGAYKYIARLDAAGFLGYCEQTSATICGAVPIAVLLNMLPGRAEAHLVNYTTSGELTGDFSMSVSYMAVAFTASAWVSSEKNTSGSRLSDEDRDTLLKLARETIEYYLAKGKVPNLADLEITVPEHLRENRAVFVTLTKHGQLRGCIGELLPVQPLFQSVIFNAVQAAVKDPRFPDVETSELDDIEIEISVLTVPEPVGSADDIRIGVDGVILQKRGRRAVFLPQVAPEQGWDVEETLTHLALKAGLNANDWKHGADFLVFQAEVFGEQ